MGDENEPTTVYTDDDIEKFLQYITNPDERAQKEAFFKGLGELGSAMKKSHELRVGIPEALSGEPVELVDRIVEGVSEVAARITG